MSVLDQFILCRVPIHEKEKLGKPIKFEEREAELLISVKQTVRKTLFPEPQISDADKEVLHKIVMQTKDQGSAVYACRSIEEATRFRSFLMHHLPLEFAALVIRGSEVNSFRETNSQSPKPKEATASTHQLIRI